MCVCVRMYLYLVICGVGRLREVKMFEVIYEYEKSESRGEFVGQTLGFCFFSFCNYGNKYLYVVRMIGKKHTH